MSGPITRDMLIADVVHRCPKAVRMLLDAGMSCVTCSVAEMETLAEGAELHGLDVDEIVAALNVCCANGECEGDG